MVRFFDEERLKTEIAQQLYDLPTEAGFTQEQVAELVGVPASVINDIEESDYRGDFFRRFLELPPFSTKGLLWDSCRLLKVVRQETVFNYAAPA
jgi:transcriptional regulator with XRE-family HTH domain